ncbi:glycosyltransferase family 2 protein, partial [Desulfosarcina sp. OttesenSCG-928-G10]|nr:glycosyltransferase family 2 protein [Desulfosarcina sp. OttesenSCG-928-G10]
MDIDIIYVNYNSTANLIESIHSFSALKHTSCRLHATVVDNASTDDPHRLPALFPDIRFIFNRKNIGFGAAVNQAVNQTHSDYLVFLNPDSLVSDGFFEDCIEFLEKNPSIGIMGPMILDEDGSLQGSARAFPTAMTTLFGRNSILTRLFPDNSISKANILTWKNREDQPLEVDWVSGACMVARRSAIAAVGGFDARFFLYWEDTDLCRRMEAAGWKVVYYPKPRITHFGARSSRTRPIFSSYQFHKSGFLLFTKYAGWPFSFLLPLAAVFLMLRFFSVIVISWASKMISPRQTRKKTALRTYPHTHISSFVHNADRCAKNKTRILYVISRLNIGGPAVHVKTLIRH